MHNRQTAMLDWLREGRRLDVRALAAHFAVSEMTIRRDLLALENHGKLARTRGGGIAAPEPAARPVSAEKVAIGRLAAGLAAPGQLIMVDTGTTALEVARHLPDDPGITIATTSLSVARELSDTPLTVLLLGGFLRKGFQSVYGPLTEHLLQILHVDTLFVGCTGVDAEGFYADDLLLFNQLQSMMRIADRIVVVAESGKFGRKSAVRYARLDQVHTFVTDAGLTPQQRELLDARGLNTMAAGVQGKV